MHILEKLGAYLSADATLIAMLGVDVNAQPMIRISRSTPVGNVYPQVVLMINEGNSEYAFPAARHTMDIYIAVENKELSGYYSKLRGITDRINELLNRQGSIFNDTGNDLRVAMTLKQGGELEYDEELNLFCMHLYYDVVVSEGESFAPSDAGDKPWVSC